TVRLLATHLPGPVFWRASGAVQIDGTIDLNGEAGQPMSGTSGSRSPSVPGAGGYPGGVGSFGFSGFPAQPGAGPGGGGISNGGFGIGAGAGHAGRGGGGTGGQAYGNDFLVPLLGGSGGGGGTNQGGGAGGGGLLIASSISITIQGTITAQGGGNFPGGFGSGGAIHLLAPLISGAGTLRAPANFTAGGGNDGAPGRIRLEAFQHAFTGTTDPTPKRATPYAVFLPSTPPPSLR